MNIPQLSTNYQAIECLPCTQDATKRTY